MSWKGVPKKENYFPLFAEDWNLLVDAVDELYYKLQTLPTAPLGVLVGGYLYGDLLPALDLYYSLGDPLHRFLNVWAKNVYADPIWTSTLYASENVLVQGKPVLKDGDPIYVADLLSPAQETLKKVLVNSVLARDLWETVPLLIQFAASDGVLQVYEPPPKYRAVVRGWYSVSTGAGGLAQLRGAYSLTPVALIPLSIPSLSVPDIFLRLYYDEPLLLYYSGATLGAYLQLLVNILNEWTGVPPWDPSGLSPFDPLWAPPDGWSYVYRFVSADELAQAFNDRSGYEVVQDGVLGWNLPPDGYGYVERYITGVPWTRVAVCLRVKITSVVESESNVIYFNPSRAPDRDVGVGFHVVAGSTTMKIKDWNAGGTWWDPPLYDFTPPDDWFVIVVDNTPGQTPYLRIYSRSKSLLFELALTTATTTSPHEDVFFHPSNATMFGTWDIEIDWIAFKY